MMHLLRSWSNRLTNVLRLSGQLPVSRKIGKVAASTHVTGFGVSRVEPDLTLRYCLCVPPYTYAWYACPRTDCG